MHLLIISLIIGLAFGILAGLVILLSRRKFTPAVAIFAGAGFLAGFLASASLFWFSLPVVGSMVLGCLLIGGITIIVLSRFYSKSFGRIGRQIEGIIMLIIAGGMISASAYFGLSSMIWRGYDQAKYFDTVLITPDSNMPFNHIITGDNVRVVDSDLAIEIIQ
ncbi:MAG: hypothetical protein EU549_03350, partial [Promethearchaeota archaeon]